MATPRLAIVPALDDLARLNATTEDELLAGATRTEPCACGGFITAHVHPDAIRGAVMEHQRTPRHRRYALRVGW